MKQKPTTLALYALTIGLFLTFNQNIAAQSALDGFDPNANGLIRAVAVEPDGKIIIGGDFTSVAPNGGPVVSRNYVARFNTDGTLDTTFDPQPNNRVYSIAVQPGGLILIGGLFTSVRPNGGFVFARNHIARFNSFGGALDGFQPGPNGPVFSIVTSNDKIFIGGQFNFVVPNNGGPPVARNNIAVVYFDGAFTPINPNANNSVYSIALQGDGKFIFGGIFTQVSGMPRNRIARVDIPNLSLDAEFDPNINGDVNSITVQADGKVLASGAFTSAAPNGGTAITRNFIARFNPNGTLDAAFNPNASSSVNSIALQSDGKILAGGAFNTISGQTRNYIARLNTDGMLDTAFDPNMSGSVTAIAVESSGKILLGGDFTSVAPNGGTAITRNRIAKLERDGRVDQTLNLNLLSDSFGFAYIRATAIQPDGKILIGGKFGSVLGQTRNRIARLNTDGTLDTTFDPNVNSEVTAIAVQLDGRILVGGAFRSVSPNGGGAVTRNNIARFNADGTLDTTFDPNPNGQLESIVVQSDGKILMGGTFTAVSPNGGAAVTRNRIARLNADGTLDTAFDPNADSRVISMAVQSDGKILAGGVFTNIGGQARSKMARLEPVTGAADSFNPNPSSDVHTIAVQSDGRILAGGWFVFIGGQFRQRIARLNADGTLDTAFNPDANSLVQSIALQSNGNILVSGIFTVIGGAGRNYFARLDGATGSADLFAPNPDVGVSSIAVQSDGKILVGGDFSNIGGAARNRFARLTNDIAPCSLLTATKNSVTLIRVHSAAHFSRVIFEQSTDNGASYTILGSSAPSPSSSQCNNYGSPQTSSYTVTGLNLPDGNQLIRARGIFNSAGSQSIEEKVQNVFLGTRPTISNLTNTSTNEDTPTGNINFTVGDAETPAANLIVTATSDNQTLVPDANITLGGSGANRTININPVPNQNGATVITVTVTDAGGLTTAETFTLTVIPVNDAPTISDIANASTDEGTPTGNINFTVSDVESAAGSLTVSATSDNQTLVPNANISLSGSDANRTINITPALNENGTATITVTVSDGALTANDTFVLTVLSNNVIVVDNTGDNSALSACTAAANDCSLRGAITKANAASGSDIIGFDAGVFVTLQTITLTGAQLTIENNGRLTINGGGKVRVSANNQSRVFFVQGGATATFNGLIITGGTNSANGGGIGSFGTVNVNNSTISGNSVTGGASGGGLSNEGGVMNVTNSTISGNSGDFSGGGLHNNIGGTMTVINSTVSGNTPTGDLGGGIRNLGTLNLTNSTISANFGAYDGGGIFNEGTVNSRNTIIAGNTASNSGPDFYGTLNSQGYNLIGNTSGATITGDTTGNILNQDAQLAPLENYGGATFTHALNANSPARNAGSNALAVDYNNQPLTTDQRGAGFARIIGGTVDMGAFEFQVILTVDNTGDNSALSACTAAANDCSLRGAIANANNSAFDETIVFDATVFSTQQTINSFSLSITNNGALTISGGGKVRINCNPFGGIFIGSGAVVTLSGLTIVDARTSSGITNNGGTLNLIASTVSGNSWGGSGGGISNQSGTMNITNSTISGNTANFAGGGIANSGTLNLTNSTVSGNRANHGGFGGGGVDSSGLGTFNSRNSIIAGNTAAGQGPDIRGTLNSQGYNLIGNTANTTITGDPTGNILNQNARLAPLGNYGGGTMTYALLSNSPAVNAGTSTGAPATDQRGANRVGNVDIGAFELSNTSNGGNFVATLTNSSSNVAYNQVITANSGSFTYSVTGGSLPTGISLTTNIAPNAVVALSGTPMQGGIFNFEITATDGANSNVTNYRMQVLAPTSATVSVSGRVIVGKDTGLTNAVVTLTDFQGNTRVAQSSSFGYYRFDDVEVGQNYIISVSSKRYQFAQQVVFVTEDIADLNFTASP